jgi:hypothetical protein
MIAAATSAALVIALVVAHLLGGSPSGNGIGLPGAAGSLAPEPDSGTQQVGVVSIAGADGSAGSTSGDSPESDQGSAGGTGSPGPAGIGQANDGFGTERFGSGGPVIAGPGTGAGPCARGPVGGGPSSPADPSNPSDPPSAPGVPAPTAPIPGPGATPTAQPGPTPPPQATPPPPAVTPQPPTPPPLPTPPPPPPPPPTPDPTPQLTPDPTPIDLLPECADFTDNDGDGWIDLADPDCFSVLDLSEG